MWATQGKGETVLWLCCRTLPRLSRAADVTAGVSLLSSELPSYPLAISLNWTLMPAVLDAAAGGQLCSPEDLGLFAVRRSCSLVSCLGTGSVHRQRVSFAMWDLATRYHMCVNLAVTLPS